MTEQREITTVKEAKNGAVQLSAGKLFVMTNKYCVKYGENAGKPVYVININQLVPSTTKGNVATFENLKTFFLNQKAFDAYIALQMQLSNKKLPDVQPNEQKKL